MTASRSAEPGWIIFGLFTSSRNGLGEPRRLEVNLIDRKSKNRVSEFARIQRLFRMILGVAGGRLSLLSEVKAFKPSREKEGL